MVGERTSEGWELRLRSRGVGRYVSAAFLMFWLCGWALGEAFAVWLLVKGAIALLTGTPPDPGGAPLDVGPAIFMGLFLLVWLTLWTVGGIAAASELLRLLFGEDRIVVGSGRLSARWLRGPFRRGRTFESHEIRRVLLTGRDDRLTLETERGRVDLSGLGTRAERTEAAAALRAELGVLETQDPSGLPRGWEEIVTPEGQRVLVPDRATRGRQAQVAGGVALVLATLAFAIGRQAVERWDLWIPTGILLAFACGAAAGARWLAGVQWEWHFGSGRLVLRKREGARLADVFVAQRLRLDVSSDSDGDQWYELSALSDAASPSPQPIASRTSRAPKNSRSIVRVMNDATTPRELGAWLARTTSLPLDDRTTPNAREAELAELRALLENSGRVGRWAGKLVDRLGSTRKKTG